MLVTIMGFANTVATDEFWSPQYVDSNDPENERIWIESPAEQASIQPIGLLKNDGDIGAQQVMVDECDAPLPWVPDVLGLEWKHPESLIIVGSAYAPFIGGFSGRDCTLPLTEYIRARSAGDFVTAFLRHVVAPDQAYYSKICLLATDFGDQRRIALLDLCRASYAVRGARTCRKTMDQAAEYTFKDKLPANKDRAGRHSSARAEASRRLFTQYIEAPKTMGMDAAPIDRIRSASCCRSGVRCRIRDPKTFLRQ